jgi:hypothetical protein
MSESNITAYINNSFTFSRRRISCDFSSVPIVVRLFCTWIAPGDAYLRFSFILVRKANALEGETKWDPAYITSIHVTDGVTVKSLRASLLKKICATTDRLRQVALERKLPRKFEMCTFSSRIRMKSRKTKSCKTSYPYTILQCKILQPFTKQY